MVEENCGAPLVSLASFRLVSRRQIGGRIDRARRRIQRADEGIISRRGSDGRSRGAKIDHVAMVKSVRNGTERPGPAPLIPPTDQKGKKRNDEVPTHAARYLTGQSISLSREIIPGGGSGSGDESHIRARDNYTCIYLYIYT